MIVRDGQIISSCLLDVPYKEIVSLLLLPYVGLYCKEAEEFLGRRVINSDVESQITDLRNSIKTFCEKYNKSEKKFILTDDKQDEYFKDLLRFDFTKDMNIHYNPGIYFNGDGHVIGNTQLVNFHLNSASLDGVNDKEDEIFSRKFPFRNSLNISPEEGTVKKIFSDTEDLRDILEESRSDYATLIRMGICMEESIQRLKDDCIKTNVLFDNTNMWVTTDLEKWKELRKTGLMYEFDIPVMPKSEEELQQFMKILDEIFPA